VLFCINQLLGFLNAIEKLLADRLGLLGFRVVFLFFLRDDAAGREDTADQQRTELRNESIALGD
jgi:hypothetical protein